MTAGVSTVKAISQIPEDSYQTRGILRGVKYILTLTEQFFYKAGKFVVVTTGLDLSVRFIKVFHTFTLPDFWKNYKFKNFYTLVLDIADSFSLACAFPQILSDLKVIPRLPSPLSVGLAVIDLAVAVGTLPPILKKANQLHNDTVLKKYNAKKALWAERKDNIEAHADEIIKSKKIQKIDTIDPEELKVRLKLFADQKVDKWEKREKNIHHEKKTAYLNVAFKISLIFVLTIVLVGTCYMFTPVIIIGAAVTGLAVSTFGLTKFIHNKKHPRPSGVRFHPIK